MYIAGIVNTGEKRVLINPKFFNTVGELYTWLNDFLNSDDFSLDAALTIDKLISGIELSAVPLLVNFAGYDVALMFGIDTVMENAIDRFVHTDAFDI